MFLLFYESLGAQHNIFSWLNQDNIIYFVLMFILDKKVEIYWNLCQRLRLCIHQVKFIRYTTVYRKDIYSNSVFKKSIQKNTLLSFSILIWFKHTILPNMYKPNILVQRPKLVALADVFFFPPKIIKTIFFKVFFLRTRHLPAVELKPGI